MSVVAIKCKSVPGMFPEELVVSLDDAFGNETSAFVHNEHVINGGDGTRLVCDMLLQNESVSVIRIPDRCDMQRVVTVNTNRLSPV